jgi:hypothetical protein
MRFRTPELFLGAFLAVAIFSMGILFASSFTPQVQNAAPHQTAEHQTSNKINENGDNVQSLWVPIDSVGLYTLVLAVFTGLLVASPVCRVTFCCEPTRPRELRLMLLISAQGLPSRPT